MRNDCVYDDHVGYCFTFERGSIQSMEVCLCHRWASTPNNAPADC